ncbi:MAG: phenylalanine--tRNA ligase subunit beta, partial [Pseudomonadota bacterium]
LSWLKEYLDTDHNIEKICETLTDIGLEVEEVTDRSTEYDAFKIALIKDTKPHPNADKLKICQVFDGQEDLQIICGAPNAQANIKVVLAPINSIIPSNKMKIKASKIRDVESFGMLCSAEELSIGEDGDGILEINDDNANPGDKFSKIYGFDDPVIEIAITPNRGDCLGVYGIARDLAAAGIGKLKQYDILPITATIDAKVKIDIVNKELCSAFYSCYFTDINNLTKSPSWLKNRLQNIGIATISPIVDITNYISYSFARPLHAYDADKLTGSLKVTNAKNSDTKNNNIFNALNNKTYELNENDLVIKDDNKIQALAGIIGGAESACDQDTKNILLEIAIFENDIVSKMSKKYGIITDSSYRFERNIDPEFIEDAINITSNMIQQICGGKQSEFICHHKQDYDKKIIKLTPELLYNYSHVQISQSEIIEILTKLGFACDISAGNADIITVTVPSWRHDVNIDIDLVEEILRIFGYNNIPTVKLPRHDNYRYKNNSNLSYARLLNIKHHLAKCGFNEIVSWSFMNQQKAQLFHSANVEELKILNPISQELDVMRPSIIPNLLEALKNNSDRDYNNVALFEVGPIFQNVTLAGYKTNISAVKIGNDIPKNHYQKSSKVNLYDAKTFAYEALNAASIPTDNLNLTADAPAWYHPGKSAAMKLGKNIIGYFGELHPQIIDEYSLNGNVVAFELLPDNFPPAKNKRKGIYNSSNYQNVSRDFAFLVNQDIRIGDLISKINKIDKKIIKNVNLFDIYEGESIPDNKKSIALSVTLQSDDRTLNENEINTLCDKIINLAKNEYEAELR